ncbi:MULTISPECIES: hypothetical protein [Cyanophyceae]|nr:MULTISPECIES: hypothetical protein [Cyanophyceae]
MMTLCGGNRLLQQVSEQFPTQAERDRVKRYVQVAVLSILCQTWF